MICDASWQSGLVADDQDPVFVDADFGNHGPQIGLSGLHACGFDLLPRKATHRYNYLSNTSGRRADEPVLFLFRRQTCRRRQ
jgi:hypothetical protein